MRPTGVRLVLLAALTGLTVATAAAETPVERATASIDALDYTTAREVVTTALDAGGNSPDDTAELYRLQGIIAGALGDAQAATDAFLRSLAIRPKTSLSAGMPPKIIQPFDVATRYFDSHEPFKIKAETSATPPTVTIIAASDPLAMMAKARVTVAVDGAPEQILEGTGTIALPAGARLDLRVSALDARGNRLADLGSKEVPIVIVSGSRSVVDPKRSTDPAMPRAPSSPRPLYLKWWAWGGASLLFAGVGTTFAIAGLRAKADLEELGRTSGGHTFDDAKRVESRARRDFLIANIGWGTAAAFAIGATVLYLTAPDPAAHAAERPTLSITPIPIRGGGAVTLEGSF